MKIIPLILAALAILSAATPTMAQLEMKMTLPPPPDYGKVVIGNYSEKAGMARAEFDHWLHRAKYTCRLCHVDIGFSMKTGATGIRAADNMHGSYCGVCHKAGGPAFAACSTDPGQSNRKLCERCHSQGGNGTRTYDYRSFTAKFPVDPYSKSVDWEKTEERGLIKMIDHIDGVSYKRAPLPIRKDFEMKPDRAIIRDILFSHKKHVVWNGCEVCHPDMFGVKKGVTQYDMDDIFDGQYCGVCHGKVAFILMECSRCHKNPVK